MPGSRLYNFTLKQPQFEITPFQAVAFEPKEQPNIGLLTNAFEKIEQRENNTSKAKADLNAMFSAIDSKLNKDDKETMDWWNKFQQQRLDAINDYIRGGDYSKAFQFATEAAGEAANDKELLARQYRYETFKKEDDKQKARVESGDIRQATYNLYKKNHPFDYEFIKDDDGNIISSKAWSAEAPVKDLDIVKFYATTFQLINPDTTKKGSSNTVARATGNDNRHDSTETGTSFSRSKSAVTVDEVLRSNVNTFLLDPENSKALRQRYEADLNELKDLEEQYNKMDVNEQQSQRGKDLLYDINLRKKLLYRNDSECGYEYYFGRLISGTYNSGAKIENIDDNNFALIAAQGLAYSNTSVDSGNVSRSTHTVNDANGSEGGSRTGLQNGNYNNGLNYQNNRLNNGSLLFGPNVNFPFNNQYNFKNGGYNQNGNTPDKAFKGSGVRIQSKSIK